MLFYLENMEISSGKIQNNIISILILLIPFLLNFPVYKIKEREISKKRLIYSTLLYIVLWFSLCSFLFHVSYGAYWIVSTSTVFRFIYIVVIIVYSRYLPTHLPWPDHSSSIYKHRAQYSTRNIYLYGQMCNTVLQCW